MRATPEVAPVNGFEDAGQVLSGWDLRGPRPVLVCVGGAQGLGAEHEDTLRSLLSDHLLPKLEKLGAVVVDGGTNSGLMRILGDAVAATGRAVPLIGVAAVGTVLLPGRRAAREDAAELEPRHTGVLLFPGTHWGDEVFWINGVADLLAGSAPSATLVANGGEITFRDAQTSVGAGRPVVVVAGTGRTADAIARAGHGGQGDPRAADLAASGLVRAVSIDDPESVSEIIQRLLSA